MRCRPGSGSGRGSTRRCSSSTDINGDGIVQFGEIRLGADIIMLATPEIGGLPYVVSALVAAGGLAAALSTADGLLLTISNAMVRDLYCQDVAARMTPEQRVILSKFALLIVALLAAFVASLSRRTSCRWCRPRSRWPRRPSCRAMVLGIFWRGATRRRRRGGHAAGLGLTVYYMLANAPGCAPALGLSGPGPCGGASSRFAPACSASPAGVAVPVAREPGHPAGVPPGNGRAGAGATR